MGESIIAKLTQEAEAGHGCALKQELQNMSFEERLSIMKQIAGQSQMVSYKDEGSSGGTLMIPHDDRLVLHTNQSGRGVHTLIHGPCPVKPNSPVDDSIVSYFEPQPARAESLRRNSLLPR